MSISSGRCRIPVMQHPKEFFDIGQPFWYSPLSDKSVEMVLVPMECKDIKYDRKFGVDTCKEYCDIYRWCRSPKNGDPISGERFIPACSILSRIDNADAYFEEYKK